jgi:molybdenum cofactor cytidylyltransferase
MPVAHKLLAPLRGSTVVELSVANALAAELDVTIVVTGAVPLPGSVVTDPRVTVVHNEHWAQGQAGSLALALDRCLELGMHAAVCGLGDQPFIETEAWELMARTSTATPIAVATYGGVRRNPVRLDASVWPLVPRTGDEGARPLLRSRPEWVTEVACPGNPIDIDTVEDLLSWS